MHRLLKVILFFTAIMSLNVQAAIIVVNSTNGGSGSTLCSLADAIIAANTGGTSGGCTPGSNGGDEILFASNLSNSTILLSADLPTITDELTITGPTGNNTITVSGDDTYSIFVVEGVTLKISNLELIHGFGTTASNYGSSGGAIAALSGAIVTVTDSKLLNNFADGDGGAIHAESSSFVHLSNCLVSNNTAHYGGGIYAHQGAQLEIVDCTFSGNSASTVSSAFGGAIAAFGWSSPTGINIRNSRFSSNSTVGYGGAIFAGPGVEASVIDSVFEGNTAHTGGAIRIQAGSSQFTSLSVARSEFSNNHAWVYAAAVYAEGNVVFDAINSSFSNNHAGVEGGAFFFYSGTVNLNTIMASGNQSSTGGAMSAWGSSVFPSVIKLTRSFLSENSANIGGAIVAKYNAHIVVSDSTLSTNSADIHGGAIKSDMSIVELSNSTLSGNHSGIGGGAFYANNSSAVKIDNSTFAENDGGSLFSFNSSGSVLRNTVLAGGHCDLDGSSNVTLTGGVHIDDGTCNATLVGPSQLAPLSYNGSGPIPTHMPIPGSPLVDHGVGGSGSNPITDQRGHPRIVGIAVDIGSVELPDPADNFN
ncbi:right-handed parallel beta-helix repeat-containing protein [Enterovibrio sp. ZSDZ42]|uniref:Right-handed parallel beta-helix repeat-containing protein n=1 Tax=Enterovibrio gelatinilyticus TaxID=2899819 RepID=A0ABT5R035_9GAMM|nr:choice-of-anchor Q domain-containing protein [Enterovibrio sp. ZSDZ42]MDD1793136.1 right-handed parallel beta-helix repeat-containing protein [Enterovibrio sp. ZSDZ42]